MASVTDRVKETARPAAPSGKLAQALLFGTIFGFLLQKGGVGKFDILIGVLLLEDFTVVEIMLSAIVVGMVGVHLLHRRGVLELKVQETVLGSNIVGGLIFGVGFALIAYCPGTNAAAVGQGNLDAIVGIFGMIAGSYLFALSSKFTSGGVTEKGRFGKLRVPELLGVSADMGVAISVVVILGALIAFRLFAG